jgi:hypothetical protein
MVHGLRKVSICLQLHLYRPPACEMQRLLRSGLLLGPSPEDGRDDYVGWRILQRRCAHALYPRRRKPVRQRQSYLVDLRYFPIPRLYRIFWQRRVTICWVRHQSTPDQVQARSSD